jgi:hypothetical protein
MTVATGTAFDTRDISASDQSAPAWLVVLALCLAAVAMAHAIYVLLAWIERSSRRGFLIPNKVGVLHLWRRLAV